MSCVETAGIASAAAEKKSSNVIMLFLERRAV